MSQSKEFYAPPFSRELFNKIARDGFSTKAALAMLIAVPAVIVATGGGAGVALLSAVGAGAATKIGAGTLSVRVHELGRLLSALS